MKKIISVVLAVVIMLSMAVPSYALSNDIVWEQCWNEEYNNGVVLFPGSDSSEMNVTWYSKTESEPKVIVSKSFSFSDTETFTGCSVEAPDGDYSNKVTITGLEAETKYYYQCISEGFESNIYYFETDSKDNEFTAVYMTDIHISHIKDEVPDDDELKRTAGVFNGVLNEAVLKHNPSILLSTGDQASDGLESEYKGLASALALKTMPIATTIGNHDRKGVAYKTFHNVPNEKENSLVSSYIGNDYWFVKGDVLFLVMDSNNASGIDHRNFVKDAINANPEVKWKVMMAHHDLYSGRIPRRESENQLLRLLWAPIADEFGIDLVLLGHSHYYTVTNVMYGNKPVADYQPVMNNPEGTIYMVSGSITRPRDDSELGLNKEWIGYANIPDQRIIYNVLDFTEDSITVSSYYQGEDRAFNTYSVVKTSADGGHKDVLFPSAFNSLVRVIGTIYAWFNNIGVYGDLKEDGFDVDVFEVVFA